MKAYIQKIDSLITDELFNAVTGKNVEGVYVDQYEGKEPHIVYGKGDDEMSVDTFCFKCLAYAIENEGYVEFRFEDKKNLQESFIEGAIYAKANQ